MVGGQRLKCRQDIIDHDVAVIVRRHHAGIIDHRDGRPRFQGFGGKLVAIERIALQGKEHTPLRAATTVGGHFGMF